jgi:hypothetical protein
MNFPVAATFLALQCTSSAWPDASFDPNTGDHHVEREEHAEITIAFR